MATSISILPSHPAEGWTSMNRYWEALVRSSDAYHGSEFEFHCPIQFAGLCTMREGKLKLAIKKKVTYPLRVRRTVRTGIAHILDHSYAFLLGAIPKNVKTIVTVHDLLPLREPEGLNAQAVARYRSRVEWLKKADLLIADSVSTHDDLIELIGAEKSKIQVIPLGAEVDFWKEKNVELPNAVQGEFIFSIGGYMKRKNLEILPKILEIARAARPNLKLVRAGEKLPDTLAKKFASRCGEGALIELGKVSENLLSGLYRSAAVTIIPSRYEGFGLPVLEAMAHGCPVVCARTTSLPEVGGDAALYFEVDHAEEAAQQLLYILGAEKAVLEAISLRGLSRARQFTWDIHFRKLLEIYRQILHGGKIPSP